MEYQPPPEARRRGAVIGSAAKLNPEGVLEAAKEAAREAVRKAHAQELKYLTLVDTPNLPPPPLPLLLSPSWEIAPFSYGP